MNNQNDFLDFSSSTHQRTPDELSQKVINFVKKDLKPDFKLVFGKLFAIQAFIGFLTLLFCPQFSLSLTNNYEMFHYFHHRFGESMCMAICGFIFIGSGAIFAAHILKPNEIKVIQSSRFLFYFSISAFALGIFMLLGVQFYLKLTSFWFFGAFLGGLSMFELNSRLKLSQS